MVRNLHLSFFLNRGITRILCGIFPMLSKADSSAWMCELVLRIDILIYFKTIGDTTFDDCLVWKVYFIFFSVFLNSIINFKKSIFRYHTKLPNISKIYLWLSPLKLWVWIPLILGVLDTTLCDKVCQLLASGRWISSGTPISSTKKLTATI